MQYPRVLDYSQYNQFSICPNLWHLRSVLGFSPQYGEAKEREDALCLGSVFHNIIENYYLSKELSVDDEIIKEFNPSKRITDLALHAILNYKSTYGQDPFSVLCTEKTYITKGNNPDWSIAAKIDLTASVPETMTLNSGYKDAPLYLNPGVYSFEDKTTSSNIEDYEKVWRINKQADFQILCLREHHQNVRGVIVNIVKIPRPNPPVRTCKNCKTKLEFSAFIPKGDDIYTCPFCSKDSKLQPLKPHQLEVPTPEFKRIVVERTEAQLNETKEFIFNHMIPEMEHILRWPLSAFKNYRNCIGQYGKKDCEFADPCEQLQLPSTLNYVQVENPLSYFLGEDYAKHKQL